MQVWAAPELSKPAFGDVVEDGQYRSSLQADVKECRRGHAFGPSCASLSLSMSMLIDGRGKFAVDVAKNSPTTGSGSKSPSQKNGEEQSRSSVRARNERADRSPV